MKLAKDSRLTRAFVCEVEKGRKKPSLNGISRIAKALNCTIDELVN